jgi:hypothetical protein
VQDVRTNVAVTCDAMTSMDIVIPDAGTLGCITGNLDIVGEFETVVDGRDDLGDPDCAGVIARSGPLHPSVSRAPFAIRTHETELATLGKTYENKSRIRNKSRL